MRGLLTSLTCLCSSLPAAAAPSVSTTGATGFVVLPAADTLPTGQFVLLTEVAYLNGGAISRPGAGPVAVAMGLPPTFELNLSMRETGLTRDRPGRSAALRVGVKTGLLEGGARWPALAMELYADHLGNSEVPGGRVLLSSSALGGVKVGLGAGYHGGRRGASHGPEVAAGALWEPKDGLEAVADVSVEGLRPWGLLAALGGRYRLNRFAAVSVNVSYGVMGPAGLRLSAGLHLYPGAKEARRQPAPSTLPEAEQEKRFTTPTPRFRMVVPVMSIPGTESYRPLQPEVPVGGGGAADAPPSSANDGGVPE